MPPCRVVTISAAVPLRQPLQPILWALVPLMLLACGEDHGASFRDQLGVAADEDPTRAPRSRIHAPPELESIATGQVGPDGEPLRAACVTCHSIPGVAPELELRAEDVGPPHEGIDFQHGPNGCAHCHDPDDRLSLRLADGRSIPMRDAIELCAQCHGPQYRDFRRGSHGGMRGFWDSEAGVRERNHCVDCHDAHRPAYPHFTPMPPPADRFAPAGHE